MNRSTLLKNVFFLIAFCHLISLILPFPTVATISKPLLIPSLAIYFHLQTRPFGLFSRYVFWGLLFSFVGDTFLMFPSQLYFILGLVSFLITHIFYSLAFLQIHPFKQGYLWLRPFWLLPFIVYWVAVNLYLQPEVGNLALPVFLYSAVITFMALSVLNLNQKLPTSVFSILFIGALMFMLSDSLIAFNKFKNIQWLLPNAKFWIMLTYIFAQYFIVQQSIQIHFLTKKGGRF